jgi:hypothetical protein
MTDASDTRVLEAVAWQVHKECQQALSNLRRQDARGSRALHLRVGTDVYLQAALIAIISEDTRTGVRFVQWHCASKLFGERAAPETLNLEIVSTRIDELRARPEVIEMVLDPHSELRRLAVTWIAEWETYQFVFCLNSKGISPPPSDVREAFCRSVPVLHRDLLSDMLETLRQNTSVQRKWGEKFRRRWNLQYARMHLAIPMTEAEITNKVSVFWFPSDRRSG